MHTWHAHCNGRADACCPPPLRGTYDVYNQYGKRIGMGQETDPVAAARGRGLVWGFLLGAGLMGIMMAMSAKASAR